MRKLFGKKSKELEEPEPKKKEEKPKSGPKVTRETSLIDADYSRKKLFKKGVNLMADEKLEEAVTVFEQALRIDPDNIETLMKLGYARFHLDEHSEALRVYDKVLDIDVANPEAWNLKGLVHYEQKKLCKSIRCSRKSNRIRSNIRDGMVQQSLLLVIVESGTRVFRSFETLN